MIKATCRFPIYENITENRVNDKDVCEVEILLTSVGEFVRVITPEKKEVQITLEAFKIAFYDLRT